MFSPFRDGKNVTKNFTPDRNRITTHVVNQWKKHRSCIEIQIALKSKKKKFNVIVSRISVGDFENDRATSTFLKSPAEMRLRNNFIFFFWNLRRVWISSRLPWHNRYIFLIPLTDGGQRQSLEGLNLARCGNRNMFGLRDGIPPQGGRPTFASIGMNVGRSPWGGMWRLIKKEFRYSTIYYLFWLHYYK